MIRDTGTGCPFWYDVIPENLRQCQKPRGHGGQHQWNGVDGFYIKWTEKLIPADKAEHDG